MGLRFVPNFEGCSYYKYRPCIRCKPWEREREREREREASKVPEKKGLEVNIKTRVCREFSWQQTQGLGLIHFGETLLGYSLLVTGRDSGLWVELGLKTDSCNPFDISF